MSNLHNELTKTPLVSLALRRMFGGEHELSVERLSETLQPIVNIWDHPYCAWLRGEDLFGAYQNSPAVALNLSYVALLNPSARGIITVERIAARSPVAMRVWLGILPVAAITPANSGTVYKRDTRAGGAGASQALPATRVLIQRGDNLAGIGANVQEIMDTSTTEVREFANVPIILHPGFGVVLEGQTVNTALDGMFNGRVRDAYPGELP